MDTMSTAEINQSESKDEICPSESNLHAANVRI